MENATATSRSKPAPYLLRLTVDDSGDLFDRGAPPCLGRQALRHEIVDYLLEQVATVPAKVPIKLNLYLPAAEAVCADGTAAAIRADFADGAAAEQRRLRRILRDGRVAVVIGLIFLILVNGLAEAIRATFSRRFTAEVANGLEIFAWVAMWRPAELLLYDWVPVRSKKNLLARLASMEIECYPRKEAN